MQVIFRDINPEIISAILAIDPHAKASVGSIFHGDIQAVVSPANSFGFMDGGIDAVYTAMFGPGVQARLQHQIKMNENAELLVGEALAISTQHDRIDWVICAPTMRVPMKIFEPIDIFLACRAAVQCALLHRLDRIAMPGMGTGCGGVAPHVAAKMMLRGIDTALDPPPFPQSWREAQERHFGA